MQTINTQAMTDAGKNAAAAVRIQLCRVDALYRCGGGECAEQPGFRPVAGLFVPRLYAYSQLI